MSCLITLCLDMLVAETSAQKCNSFYNVTEYPIKDDKGSWIIFFVIFVFGVCLYIFVYSTYTFRRSVSKDQPPSNVYTKSKPESVAQQLVNFISEKDAVTGEYKNPIPKAILRPQSHFYCPNKPLSPWQLYVKEHIDRKKVLTSFGFKSEIQRLGKHFRLQKKKHKTKQYLNKGKNIFEKYLRNIM